VRHPAEQKRCELLRRRRTTKGRPHHVQQPPAPRAQFDCSTLAAPRTRREDAAVTSLASLPMLRNVDLC
jgi:hypothetical protein